MPKLRAVIFDIGRVLIRVEIQRVKSSLAQGLPFTPEELWSAIEKDPRWPDWQEGRMSPRDWHLHLTKRFNLSLDFEQFKNVWNSALDPEPIHKASLFSGLSKTHRLGLLSNTDPIHVEKLESTYDFFAYFPKSVRTYSCSVGASKPDPLIFREALRACKVAAGETVYIDDIRAYVEAARRLGFTGIHYQSPAQLYTDLGQAGIEVEKSCTT
ncbi:MAG TPA: HAD family phosphatase [Candidatus Limnocylindrales bacterium]|nr:HAD family phosphatase [Candidatus Limnocylindrales bacterium]